MPEKHPLISVIMPAYNAAKYIEEAIQSVLEQTYGKIELIVIDDCSKDNTCQVVEAMAEKHTNIFLYKNEKNMGVADTRNRGLQIARGDYIALLDSDDVWRKDKIEKQLHLMQTKRADLAYCSYAFIDENSGKIRKDFLVADRADLVAMLKKNVVGCSTVMLTKEVADKYRFNKAFYHEDYVLWLQILRDGYTARGITEVLVDYRIVSNSRSSNKIKCAKERWKIYREFMGLSVGEALSYWLIYVLEALKKHGV